MDKRTLEQAARDLDAVEDALAILCGSVFEAINPPLVVALPPAPEPELKVIRPDMPERCMAITKSHRPCRLPAVFPMQLCYNHFRERLGHKWVMKDRPGFEWITVVCTICGATWRDVDVNTPIKLLDTIENEHAAAIRTACPGRFAALDSFAATKR